jgi:hypothetical protein
MDVRDAVEADAESLAAIADSPADVMRNLVHDRTVRVAVEGPADAGPNADADASRESILGFVSFDARPNAVHVTQLDGTREACTRLLEEPLSFARRERMPVELLVPAGSQAVTDAVEDVGFEERGPGPRFDGEQTLRYRFES